MIEINNVTLGSDLSVAVVQLESPYDKELMKGRDPFNSGRNILFWRDPSERAVRIISITRKIIEKYDELNLIVFPEYSIPQECWTELQEISSKHNILIIGGSDYVAKFYQNICPIFIPNTETKYIVKANKSIFETDIFFSTELQGESYFLETIDMVFNVNEELFSIQTFICSDFLRGVSSVNITNTGLLICTMCSPHTKSFYGLSEYYIRLNKPKFVLFSNSIDTSSKNLINGGMSGICCSGNDDLISKNIIKDKEGVLYAKLNLLTPRLTKPTAIGNQIPISNNDITELSIRSNNEIDLITSCSNLPADRAVINPDLFRVLGKKFRIFYLKCSNYADTLSELQKTNTYSASVLGDVDVIIKNINNDSRRAREYDFHKVADHFKDKSWDYFSVDRFLKYEGIVVVSGYTAIDVAPSYDEICKLVQLAKGNASNATQDDVSLYIRNKWIIGNINDCEIDSNIRGIINIYLPDISPSGNLDERFENEVICDYLNNPSISGIYAGAGKGLQAMYIFEVCCNICNLFNIVETIHDKSLNRSIRINTNSYLISKKLSVDLYSTLEIPSIPYEISNIINTYIMKDIGHDFCNSLSTLEVDKQKYISQWYVRMNQHHGRINNFLSIETRNEIKYKYITILELIKDVKIEYSKYLVYSNNIFKAGSSFNRLFGLFEIFFQEIIEIIISEHFDSEGNNLLKSDKLKSKFKPNSPKSDTKRLTFREKVNLVRGCIEIDCVSFHIPFNDDNFFEKEELETMISYRNIFQHQKNDDIEKINTKTWTDLMLWLLSFVTPEVVELIKFPQLSPIFPKNIN